MSPRDGVLLRAPIFLNCMSRGGSNIFWNFFLTHPEVCSPIRETLEIFRADWRAPTAEGLWLAVSSGQPRLFDQWHLRPRRPLSRSRQLYVDRVLRGNMMKTVDDPEMRYKSRDETYSREEVEQARLVAKNNNGLVFLNGVFREIYPDASFFCLVRHPVPLYESHKRRRLWRDPAAFADYYNTVAGEMVADAGRGPGVFLTRFEDVLSDPLGQLEKLYRQAGLDMAKIDQLRLRSKEHFQRNGSRGSDWKIGHHHWLDFDEVPGFLDSDINRLHSARLDSRDRSTIMERTATIRERLGYDD